MAYIEKRESKTKGVYYRATIRKTGKPIIRRNFSTKTLAKEWATLTEAKIMNGKGAPQRNHSQLLIEDIIHRYIEKELPKKPNIQQDWTNQLNWWNTQIGDIRVFDIDTDTIYRVREILQTEKIRGDKVRSNSTINNYTATLSAMFSKAKKLWRVNMENPITDLEKLEIDNERVRSLSKKERETLLKTCKDSYCPYLHPIVLIALGTGARKMEILNLKWKDIDLDNDRAKVDKTKNKTRMGMTFQGELKDVLLDLYKNKTSDVWVFPSKDGTKSFDIRRSWERAIKDADIEDFRFHDLRHTTATYMGEMGCSPFEIQKMLNHKTIQMAMKYTHIPDSHKKGLQKKLLNKIFGESE